MAFAYSVQGSFYAPSVYRRKVLFAFFLLFMWSSARFSLLRRRWLRQMLYRITTQSGLWLEASMWLGSLPSSRLTVCGTGSVDIPDCSRHRCPCGSLTSTIQYFKPSLDYTWGRRNLSNQNPALVEAIHLLKREALPGQVVLSTSNELILAMTELRVPYFALWPFSFASKDEIAGRSRDYADFWKAWEA